jgi:hypothetical protein
MFSQINVPVFPAAHPQMFVVAQFAVPPAEYGRKFKLTVKLIDEDGQEMFSTPPLDQEAPRGTGLSVYANVMLRLISVVFPKAGTYEFSALVDGDTKGSLPLTVLQLQMPESTI